MELPRLRRIRWAVRFTLILGVAASVAANVLHALDNPISQAIAAWPPLALLLTVELISRVPVHRRWLAVARLIATATIAGIAAWVSYWHMVGVASRFGESGASPYLIPLSVDGLIVVASICLVELGGRITAIETATRSTPAVAAAASTHHRTPPAADPDPDVVGPDLLAGRAAGIRAEPDVSAGTPAAGPATDPDPDPAAYGTTAPAPSAANGDAIAPDGTGPGHPDAPPSDALESPDRPRPDSAARPDTSDPDRAPSDPTDPVPANPDPAPTGPDPNPDVPAGPSRRRDARPPARVPAGVGAGSRGRAFEASSPGTRAAAGATGTAVAYQLDDPVSEPSPPPAGLSLRERVFGLLDREVDPADPRRPPQIADGLLAQLPGVDRDTVARYVRLWRTEVAAGRRGTGGRLRAVPPQPGRR